MILRKINEQGLFLEDVILDAIPTIKQIQVVDDVEIEVEVNDPHYIQEVPVGFYLPRWDGEKWVEGKVFSQEELQSQINQKIEQLSKECEQNIISGFESDCLGEVKLFDSSIGNQATIQGLILTAIMNKSGLMPIPEIIEHKTMTDIDCFEFTDDQIIKLGLDLKAHITKCKKDAEAKINELLGL